MSNIQTLQDLVLLRESVSLECKLASGRDGKGALPEDFWPTYSAMANTDGGVVVLGMRESKGHFVPVGIENPGKVRTDLFNSLNNRQKVSVNLLTDNLVREWLIDGKTLLVVEIPRARRQQRPVHLSRNPFEGNTYRRLNEGDRPLPDEEVKRMLAEQVEESRDSRVLPHFGLKDLDADSLKAYRNIFRADKPDHPWLTLDDEGFLRMLGGWREDRTTGVAGLTVAGLLMFGVWPSISEALPHYFLDYQERPSDQDSDARWLDRIVPDGTWSGNVFDFYRRVVLKLTADLKVPFVLKNNFRQDDTPAHQAIREALINTLVHADYSDHASVLVIKQPSGFRFRNPGMMRVPAALAMQGGESDCRNRIMQQMFLMIGLGERAGSGLPKIIHGWREAGHSLILRDSFEPYDQTVLEMGWREPLYSPGSGESSGESSGETGDRILALLLHTPKLTIPSIAQSLGLTTRAVEKQLTRLKKLHRLRRVGPNKGGHWEVLP
jgi:ATP-dependent DNA helicase RecG